MYPLKFENIYFEKIWGGRDLDQFRNNLPEGNIGESWDVACHPHGTSVVSNGPYKGLRLDQLMALKGEKLMGTRISKNWFPLLVKVIHAREPLSIQVHPNDAHGRKVEGEPGKTEAWYVMEAVKGAHIILGMKKCTREQLVKAIERGRLDMYMNKISVKKGDVYFVKSGLIHAIGAGMIIVEIQQNSDTTYRIYDYNRGRELHVQKALEVVDLTLIGKKSEGLKIEKEGYDKTYYCLDKNFSLELYEVKDSFLENSDKERFYIFTCVEGQGEIQYVHGTEKIEKGSSIFIPASLGHYKLRGRMKLIKCYVPDVKKVEEEILQIVKS